MSLLICNKPSRMNSNHPPHRLSLCLSVCMLIVRKCLSLSVVIFVASSIFLTSAAPARSSLVVDVNNNASTSEPFSATSSSTSSGTNRMRSPPGGGGNVSGSGSGSGAVRWKGEFPSPPPPQPQKYHPTHHSEAGRRYSVFGPPPSLSNALAAHQAATVTAAALRRHSSVMPTILTPSAPATSPPNTNAFNASTALQLRQQQHIQNLSFDNVKVISQHIRRCFVSSSGCNWSLEGNNIQIEEMAENAMCLFQCGLARTCRYNISYALVVGEES